ncbi:MAG: hypothetical protein GQ523_09320 [Methanophagales archaeon]|nr:hypothetical protein [Methanophagales archaeon]
MLRETKAMPTPLTKQINQLIRIILLIAAATFVGVLAIGLARGNSFDSLFQLGVALAVGSIPDALPAVVTTVLSLGNSSHGQEVRHNQASFFCGNPRFYLCDLLG